MFANLSELLRQLGAGHGIYACLAQPGAGKMREHADERLAGGVFIADRQQATGHPFGTIRAGHGNFVGRQRHTVIPPAAELGPILVPIAYGDTETNSPPIRRVRRPSFPRPRRVTWLVRQHL
jgi:hypothetical protein